MGVPSFYRWLLNKYPKIVCNAVEEKEECLDYRSPNPNGFEFDNLYLDMNGIIHPCFHPDDPDNLFPPTTYDEVFRSIYDYIDRLFNLVRPRNLLFLAIDGVAPRAKMNQQRARRFRTAKDIQIAEEMEEKLRKQFERERKAILPKKESQVADSNVITPGTEFMHELSEKLQSYISRRMSESSAWANIKVILSDDNVPGEGEHKIMTFIRAQRSSPGYDPNTRHCLYGLDADLIMLALATHEIHFSILREEVLSPVNQYSHVPTSYSTTSPADTRSLKSRAWFKEHPWQNSSSGSIIESKKEPWNVKKVQPYQFLNIWILREYVALDLKITGDEKFESDLERIIDDFIFICFFAGNDFLPHVPGLEIHEGCLDLLLHVYKEEFHNLGGYLVNMQMVDDKKGGYMKLKRVERFILMIGSYEDKIFSKRSQLRDRKMRWILNEYNDAKKCEKNDADEERASDIACQVAVAHEELDISTSDVDIETVLSNTKELNQKLKDYIKNQSDLFKDGALGSDKVKFGTAGWRERYYKEKFAAETAQDIEATRKDVVAKYGEGLCWVLLYYFSGVPSWTWYYPYHYGPLASDLKGLSQTIVKFQKGVPFKPFDQLMGVLPPRSAHALPSAYKGVMIDQNSNIIDFYPTEFEMDTDGKRFTWQGISKLPFIDEGRLLIETKKLENELKGCEQMRNAESLDRLFVSCSTKFVLHNGTKTASKKIKDAIAMESPIEGINGTIHLMLEDLNKGGDARYDLCMFYEVDGSCRFVPRVLERVNVPEKTVDEDDIVETILWHEASNGNRYQNRRLVKPEQNWESRSQNPNPAFISKGAGRGFSVGRGKSMTAQTSSISGNCYNNRGFQGNSPNTFSIKPEQNWESRSQNPNPAFISKGAGRGFSVGRGKSMTAQTSSISGNCYNNRGFQGNSPHTFSIKPEQKWETRSQNPNPAFISKGTGRGSGLGRGKSMATQTSSFSGNYGAQNYNNSGFQDLRISDSSPFPVSNNNQPRWQGRGNSRLSERSSIEDWRLNKPSGADPGPSWRRNIGPSSGPAQYMDTGHGRGRGRGWVATQK
ncbi:hypothetical protein CASFOL_003071 [Castilleja foliolosa]|uniref:5'-3' exoribonuclease n=1 Tax=Castilleja foliolosa TaxID=1961234 RepID=A0ABD3EGH5_9LAMI